MFSSRNFMVSGHTLWSLIHLEFIFLGGVTKCCNFVLLPVSVQSSQHHLLERLCFPSIYSCPFCWFIISVWVTFWNLSCSIGLCVLFLPVLCVLISFVIWSQGMGPYLRWFWLFRFSCFSIQTSKLLVPVSEHCHWYFTGGCIEFQVTLGSKVILTTFIIPIQEHGLSLHMVVLCHSPVSLLFPHCRC